MDSGVCIEWAHLGYDTVFLNAVFFKVSQLVEILVCLAQLREFIVLSRVVLVRC